MEYLLHHMQSDVDIQTFNEAAGVGVVVTPDEIDEVVRSFV